MKNLRQAKLCEIINRQPIETQEALQALLKEEGFDVTQATISRDIKTLSIYKKLTPDRKYCYALPEEAGTEVFSSRLRTIFRESVSSIDIAQNIVVIKTISGMAQAAGTAVDALKDSMVVGSLAGDDTAFVALRSEDAAKELADKLRRMIT